MPEKKSSGPKRGAPGKTARKPRKHGYRGYGSGISKGTAGGAVHFGRGFTGVEPLGSGSATLPEARLFSENLKEKTSKS